MIRFLAVRIASAVPVFFGATLLVFMAVFVLPGDPVQVLAGDQVLPPETVAAIRARYHLDEPVLQQYLRFLAGLFTGDLGTTVSGERISDSPEPGRSPCGWHRPPSSCW